MRGVVDGAYSGSIVSLHDGNAATVKALPKIIKGLKGGIYPGHGEYVACR